MKRLLAICTTLHCLTGLASAQSSPGQIDPGHTPVLGPHFDPELAFDAPVRREVVRGIDAGTRGQLIAEARRVAGGVELVVEPRHDARFAHIGDEQNAVLIRGRAVGEVWLSGKGAGSMPTAAALLSDVVLAQHAS